MDREKSVQEIARLRALGMSDQTIALRLSLAGASSGDVSAALSAVTLAPALPVQSQKVAVPSKLSASSILAAFIALAFVGGSGVAGYFFLRPPVVYSISLQQQEASSTPIVYGALPALADRDYYEQVREQFIESKASFINADLSSMKLYVYQKGAIVLSVPILAKGKPGSWWETPVGVYKIETKEKNHFSTFGSVYMPWSMEFDGNFFIHGWPHYEDGSPVSSSYSGGCIRLSDEDALKVFELASVGMPVIVYKAEDNSDAYQYGLKGPSVPAQEYLVADIRNGTVLLDKNASTTRAIASLTKLVTALIVIEHFNLDKSITISREMIVETTNHRLRVGQSETVHDLLILMLTESSNEAAEAFAVSFGRGQFMSLMNKKALAIGMTHTNFADPSGLDARNTSTAEDLYTLIKYIYENRKFVFDITSNSLIHDAYGEVGFKNLENFNFIPGVKYRFIGGKIGITNEARETYAGIFGFDSAEGERPIAVIVLGSPDVQKDVATVLRSLNTLYAH